MLIVKNVKIMEGLRFGRLQVLGRAGTSKDSNQGATWLCQCDCGKTKVIRRGASLRLPDNEGLFRALYRARKIDAERRGYTFELSIEEFRKLIHQNCAYCGIPPNQIFRVKGRPSATYIYNGVDRIDNSKGYSRDNVCSCCGTCNTMKGALTSIKFLEQVVKIFNTRGLYGA